MPNDVRICQNCHGNGMIRVEVKPGKWEDRKCYACNGTGRIVVPLI